LVVVEVVVVGVVVEVVVVGQEEHNKLVDRQGDKLRDSQHHKL
jgi:hypothetical protein